MLSQPSHYLRPFLSDVDEIIKFLDVRRYSVYDPVNQVKKPTNPNLPVRHFPPKFYDWPFLFAFGLARLILCSVMIGQKNHVILLGSCQVVKRKLF